MKKIGIVILCLVTIISFTACSSNDYGDYQAANERTEQIEKGKATFKMAYELEIDTENISPEERKAINYFKEVLISSKIKWDDEKEQASSTIFTEFGGIGFDTEFYMDGESQFIKLPMISKYMLLDGIDGGSGEKTTAETGNEDLGSWISAESIEKIDEKWNEIATKDNIYSESDALIETPDGEVKAKRYSFKLENQQFKEYIVAFMEVLKEDTVLKEKIAGNSFMQNAEGFDVEVLFENFAESLKSAEVVSFESSDYVDIDGYVVNDVVKYELRFANSPMGGLKGMKMRIENVRYDIEKDVEINIPELTEENTIDSENMKEGMPFMFEDIFNKKE